jgi:hypothetical protein
MALTNGELKVVGLENSSLAGGQAILVDSRKDLLGRASDDAALRLQSRRCDEANDESDGDQERSDDYLFAAKCRTSIRVSWEKKTVQ